MMRALHRWLLLISLSSTLAKEHDDLPLCPTNIQYFPQDLPMHCRMPGNLESGSHPQLPQIAQYPTLPPLSESFYQRPSPDKQPPPIPIPIPPFPGIPGAMPAPMAPMGGPMPMPVPIMGGPAHKMPVIVMPFYSPDHSFKKPHGPHRDPKRKPPHKHKKRPFRDSDTDTSSSDKSSGDCSSDASGSSSEFGYWKGGRKARKKITRRFNKRHGMKRKEGRVKNKDLLTPILQYVTKDGYVIFEKKISKNEAKDWLKPKNEVNEMKDEVKLDEKDNEGFLLKSAEEPPPSKAPAKEEVPAKIEQNSRSGEHEQMPKSKRVMLRKHRPRTLNALLNMSDRDS